MINSKLILGTVQMGLSYGVNNPHGKIPELESHAILKHANLSGIQYLDTAEAYGDAHQVIGNFHRENPRHLFKVITKIPAVDSVVNAEEKIQRYLNELGIDQLEALMFHSFDTYRKHLGLLPALTQLKKQKMFFHLGVSIYTNEELEALIDDKAVDIIQLPFNLLDNVFLRGDLLEKAKRSNKIIHTRSAFLQGMFFKETSDQHRVVKALKDQLDRIHQIAKEKSVSVAALALSYCLHQKKIDQVLIGVDSIRHLTMNLEAAQYQIDRETIDRINEIRTKDIALLNPSLWH